MVEPEERKEAVEEGVEKVQEVIGTNGRGELVAEVKLDERHVDKLAMLSGILGRNPSTIVTDLLDAAFPDHLMKKWREEHTNQVRKYVPTVHWELPK